MHTFVCVCAFVSRCSATTTSCTWIQWARQMQASMYARPSCPGLAWERLRLCSLWMVSYGPVALLLITMLISAEEINGVQQILMCALEPQFCVKYGRVCGFWLFCTSCMCQNLSASWTCCMWVLPPTTTHNDIDCVYIFLFTSYFVHMFSCLHYVQDTFIFALTHQWMADYRSVHALCMLLFMLPDELEISHSQISSALVIITTIPTSIAMSILDPLLHLLSCQIKLDQMVSLCHFVGLYPLLISFSVT